MTPAARFCFIICACLLLSPIGSIVAQPVYRPAKDSVVKAKPYKLLTAGKQITIRSNTTNILSVMVWTSGGHRVLEQKDINASSYQFRISVNASAYFMMIRMADGRSYSEKIGVAQ